MRRTPILLLIPAVFWLLWQVPSVLCELGPDIGTAVRAKVDRALVLEATVEARVKQAQALEATAVKTAVN